MRTNKIGRYELLEELSRGGMGVVYRARDPLIDRIVAIKTIGMGLSRIESEAFDKRFDREARSAGRLNHPNIVTIHDMGRSDDGAYIAMEFIDGRSLRDVLDTGVVLEPARIAQIVAQIADGLAYAHEHGVIHCDIKPANVMVLAGGRVKITDFGIARLPTGSRTFAGNVVGSPRYISPEQILGRPIDARSDIFSLGAVLYEMLTGVPPFGGGELDEILFQVINDKPEPPSSRVAGVPKAFDAIVDRALAKSPSHRYATATDMASDLRRLAAPRQPTAVANSLPAVRRRRRARSESTTTVLISGPDGAEAPLLDEDARTVDVRAIGTLVTRPQSVLYATAVLILAASVWLVVDGRPSSAEEGRAAAAASEPRAPAAAVTPTTQAASFPLAPAPADVETPVPASEQPRARPAPAARPTAAQQASVAKAHLTLAITPWGEVFVDGRRRGVSPPLTELDLPPGRHTIEIRNAAFAPRRETVDVVADASVRIKHKFE